VRVQGADAVKFLQGQVSNDVARLTADRSVLAGLHNAQGRAIAVLRLVLAGPEEILVLVPRELAGAVAARLGKFVLRAKVKIVDASSEWDVAGVEVGGIAEGLPVASIGAARRDEDGRLWVCVATDDAAAFGEARSAGGPAPGATSARVATSRWLVASGEAPRAAEPRLAEPRGDEAGAAHPVGGLRTSLTPNDWHAADIADGIPQVFAATSEAFVAQMLNLDLLDGIAFDKGCYTGQEVIARAHYRGKVKRRMQRFRTGETVKLNPGDSGTLNDGRHFKVVDAVQLADGRSEFLAVTTFTSTASDEPSEAPPTEHPPVNAEQLPLPYSLPA
jgi:folate-binding protein YgfZ